jgi:putative acetyltransferase
MDAANSTVLEPPIRTATPTDHAAIRAVVAAAFGSEAEAELVDRIRASEQYEPTMDLVALAPGGAIAGHVMISRALLCGDDGTLSIAMLSPLSVAPDHQRRGLGRALVLAATRRADQHGEPLVVLEGNPAYYSRLGFIAASEFGIVMPLPDWAPVEAAQVMPLAAYDAADPRLRGRVVYPSAFDAVG